MSKFSIIARFKLTNTLRGQPDDVLIETKECIERILQERLIKRLKDNKWRKFNNGNDSNN